MARLSTFVLSHRKRILAGWFVLLLLGGYGASQLGDLLSNRFSVPGADSERGLDLIKARMQDRSDGAFTLVATGVDSPAEQAAVAAAAAVRGASVITAGRLLLPRGARAHRRHGGGAAHDDGDGRACDFVLGHGGRDRARTPAAAGGLAPPARRRARGRRRDRRDSHRNRITARSHHWQITTSSLRHRHPFRRFRRRGRPPVALEIGGSNQRANLFPDAALPRPGPHEEDRLENTLHDEVCARALTLRKAQRLIARVWVAAYRACFS
jgi:hypothetical protein